VQKFIHKLNEQQIERWRHLANLFELFLARSHSSEAGSGILNCNSAAHVSPLTCCGVAVYGGKDLVLHFQSYINIGLQYESGTTI